MPPSSRTTMRLPAAWDGDQTEGAASATAPAPAPSNRRRREVMIFDALVMSVPSLRCCDGRRSCGRIGRRCLRQNAAGIEKTGWIERLFHRPHQRELDRRLVAGHLVDQRTPDAVLGTEGAAERGRDIVDGKTEAFADRVAILQCIPFREAEERDEMDVAVAHVADDHERT